MYIIGLSNRCSNKPQDIPPDAAKEYSCINGFLCASLAVGTPS